jgi:DNA-binding NtrC family response regulator
MAELSLKVLLAIVEQGGYPDFTCLYEEQGYVVTTVKTVRKANAFLKKNSVDVLVAEFNFQTDFRDRTSSLESILASVQHQQDIKVVILIDKKNTEHFKKVSSRFPIHSTLTFPIDEELLRVAVN